MVDGPARSHLLVEHLWPTGRVQDRLAAAEAAKESVMDAMLRLKLDETNARLGLPAAAGKGKGKSAAAACRTLAAARRRLHESKDATLEGADLDLRTAVRTYSSACSTPIDGRSRCETLMQDVRLKAAAAKSLKAIVDEHPQFRCGHLART